MEAGFDGYFKLIVDCLDYACKLPLHFIAKVKVIIKKEVCTLQCIHHQYCFIFSVQMYYIFRRNKHVIRFFP